MDLKLERILIEPKLILKDFYHFFSNNYKIPRSYFFSLLPYQFFRIKFDNYFTKRFRNKFMSKYKKEYLTNKFVEGGERRNHY